MKLIRCYIENFGGLQQYTVEFNEGLTVIHEPNGFGKTTLAEFIRAMFYGFPRNNKDISKSPRMKYLPWQGGRYGGYLIFEHNGKRYRIDRSFGDAPKGDKFKLFNEDTHRESHDFPADVGQKLFGLDGDSFMRSTYMPQIRDNGPMTTDNIRAKLGNLLEDTGDVGNYDKALQKLKDKRTVYEHYRGSGGSIHEAQKKISALQQTISDCAAKQPRLDAVSAELAEAKQAQALGEGALQHIRRQLSEATTAEAEAALSREYEKLCRDKADTAQALDTLTNRYPKGIPTAEALDALSKGMDRYAALESQPAETPADRAAAQTVADHAARFAQGVPTAKDFAPQRTALDRLITVGSELRGAALTEEEAQQLELLRRQLSSGIPTDSQLEQYRDQISQRGQLLHTRSALELSQEDNAQLSELETFFAHGVPDDPWFAQCNEDISTLTGLVHARRELELSQTDKARLAELDAFFAHGVPDDAWIAQCNEDISTLTKLTHTQRTLVLAPEDQARLDTLNRWFAAGVPTQEEIDRHEQKLRRAEELRRENLELSAAVSPMVSAAPAPQKKFHGLFFPMLVISALMGALGICLLAAPTLFEGIAALYDHHTVIGGICAVAAFAACLTAVFLQNNHNLISRFQAQSTYSGITPEQRRRMEAAEAEAAALEHAVIDFLSVYPVGAGRSLSAKLGELTANRGLYIPLKARADAIAVEAEAAYCRIDALNSKLTKQLSDYFHTVPAYDAAVQTISANKPQYLQLRGRRDQLARQAADNDTRTAALRSSLNRRLSPYFPNMPTFETAVQTISANKPQYLQLCARRDQLARQAAENDARTAALTDALQEALSPYFDTIVSFDTAVQTLTRRIEQFEALSHKQEEAAARREVLTAEMQALEEKISTFLLQYGVKAAPTEYRQALDTLSKNADSYTAAVVHLQQRAEALAARDEECAALRKKQQDICAAYGLNIPMGDRQALKNVERDAEEITRLKQGLTLADGALADFIGDHGHKPACELKQADYDLEGLKAGEQELIRKQNGLRTDILRLEQQSRLLRAELDRIPELTDELTRLTERKAADTQSRCLLDSTVDFLQKARESLSASYLGGVQGHFARYLNCLTGEDVKHIAVNTDLEVQLERAGSNRALPHFSAGQTDAVQLCMRLALADALFEGGSCFMILDDPFVNLDDHHTAQALKLLEELSEDRQIIYLVCNSSRI